MSVPGYTVILVLRKGRQHILEDDARLSLICKSYANQTLPNPSFHATMVLES